MRVAFVCTDPGVPAFGHKGSSVHVQSVLGVLVDRGASVHLLTTAPVSRPPGRLADVRVHSLPVPPAVTAADREVSLQQADAAVARTLDAIQHAGRLDVVYERYSLWGGTATTWASRNGVPSVLEMNAPLIEEQAEHRVLVDRAAAERITHKTLCAADTVVCVSGSVARWAKQRTRHSERVHVIANGVDTHRVRPASRPPPPRPFTVGFVGTLKPWHGVGDLVDALALLTDSDRDCRLLVVGDGPQAPAIRAQVHGLGLDDLVEMTGAVDPARLPPLLHRFHVAVAPYPPMRDFYFSPLKVYEYLAAGLPVVATRVGDLPATLDDGRTGVLVEPGRPAAIARAIGDLRADPARRGTLAREARRAAVAWHDWDAVVTRTLALTGAADEQS